MIDICQLTSLTQDLIIKFPPNGAKKFAPFFILVVWNLDILYAY